MRGDESRKFRAHITQREREGEGERERERERR